MALAIASISGLFAAPNPPVCTSMSPTSGGAGTIVTLTGSSFGSRGNVVFSDGSVSVTSNWNQLNNSSGTTTVPTGITGNTTVTLNITDPAPQAGTCTFSGTFNVIPPPTVSGISPATGYTAGGETVTISGTNFEAPVSVTIAGLAATVVSRTSTSIVVTTPARQGQPGAVPVVVTAAGGNVTFNSYTYVQNPPTVSSLNPTFGAANGGTTVVITGTYFYCVTGGSGVRFGGTNATSYIVNSPTQITAVAPAGSGTQDVSVTNCGGTSTNTANDDYTYIPSPTISGISPVIGPASGGQTVTITGTNFNCPVLSVTVGGVAATITASTSTSITITTPAGTAGNASVVVTNCNGPSAGSNYTYVANPTVSSISPTIGPAIGGQTVTITGTGFNCPTLGVTIGGVAATITASTATSITVTTPAGTAGNASVVVSNCNGNSPGTNYTYVGNPTVSNINPAIGPANGGQTVTITGTGFNCPTLSVTIGGVPATITASTATSITITTPAGTAGNASLVVSNCNGNSTGTNYTYVGDPTVSGINPAIGPTSGGQTVTITGTGFNCPTLSVTIGGVAATSVTFVNATTITVVTPAGTAGTASVVVTNCNGHNGPNSLYTYVGLPTVSGISPAVGPTLGGTPITITGTGFNCPTVSVTIGGVPATSIVVVNSTTITAVTPAGSAGAASVVVTNCTGSSAPNYLYTYQGVNNPAFTCVGNAGVPPLVRSEGLSELVGDLVLNCTGGRPTANGQPVPQANIQIFLNTNITSRLSNSGDAALSEALLMIDEPASGVQRLCNTDGGCGLTGTGAGTGVNYAASGVKNVYQGRQSGANSIVWLGVPIDAPGPDSTRVIRITNVRANANQLGTSSTLIPTQIVMFVSVTGSTAVPINNPQQTVAFIQPGLSFSVKNVKSSYLQCVSWNKDAATDSSKDLANGWGHILKFKEGFASSFKKRTRNSGASDTTSYYQDSPGAIYNTESGFYSAALNNANIGVASNGTRLLARFANVPAGVTLYTSVKNVGVNAAVDSITAADGSGAGYAARLVSTDSVGAGAYSEATSTTGGKAAVSLSNGNGIAVWEVTDADPLLNQEYYFGVAASYVANSTSNLPGLGSATVSGNFAPQSSVSTASASAPTPRFADTAANTALITINACTTNLLFPFLTNQNGYDSGIAIANTSVDPFGGATAQNGPCKLNYYGETLGGGAAPAAQTSATVPNGKVLTAVLSTGGNFGIAATPGFQGYMIAQCQFQYAHGFAFISDLGANRVSEAYLALVLDSALSSRSGYASESVGK